MIKKKNYHWSRKLLPASFSKLLFVAFLPLLYWCFILHFCVLRYLHNLLLLRLVARIAVLLSHLFLFVYFFLKLVVISFVCFISIIADSVERLSKQYWFLPFFPPVIYYLKTKTDNFPLYQSITINYYYFLFLFPNTESFLYIDTKPEFSECFFFICLI